MRNSFLTSACQRLQLSGILYQDCGQRIAPLQFGILKEHLANILQTSIQRFRKFTAVSVCRGFPGGDQDGHTETKYNT